MKVNKDMSCSANAVIVTYMLEKPGTLYQRHLLNLSRIRTRHNDPVAQHFYTNGHSVADYSVMGLENLNGSAIYRRTVEQLWKDKLQTYRLYGMNVKEYDEKARQDVTWSRVLLRQHYQPQFSWGGGGIF